jgi:hypothetical protein
VFISQQSSGFQEFTASSFPIHGNLFPTPSDDLSKNRISAARYLPIRFLETPTCHSMLMTFEFIKYTMPFTSFVVGLFLKAHTLQLSQAIT